MILILERGRL